MRHKHTDNTDWTDEHGFFLLRRNFDFTQRMFCSNPFSQPVINQFYDCCPCIIFHEVENKSVFIRLTRVIRVPVFCRLSYQIFSKDKSNAVLTFAFLTYFLITIYGNNSKNSRAIKINSRRI